MPYESQAQAAYFNKHRQELEAQGVNVDEWNEASKGLKLPKHATQRLMHHKPRKQQSPLERLMVNQP